MFLLFFLITGSSIVGYAGDGGRPTAASLYNPWDVAVDKWGNVYFTDYQYSAVRLINTTSRNITSIVSGLYTSVQYTSDAGPASLAKFYHPSFLTMDPFGQALYIGDSGNNVIRSISLSTQSIFPSKLCPSGQAAPQWFGLQCTGCCACAKGSYCPGNNNMYTCPAGTSNNLNSSTSATACVVCNTGSYSSKAGSLTCSLCPAGTYSSSIAGTGSTHCVSCPIGTYNPTMGSSKCMLCPAGMEALGGATACSYSITTIAGVGGLSGSTGDGGNGVSALLSSSASGFTTDNTGQHGYIADYGNRKIRVLDLTMGTITTLATSLSADYAAGGTSTSLPATMYPFAVDIGGTGKVLFVVDYTNHIVRKIVLSTGIMSRYVGSTTPGCTTDSTTLGNAFSLNYPRGIVVDSSNNVYIADTGNHRIVMTMNSTYMTSIVAGQTLGVVGGNSGSTGDGDPATSARLNAPWGVALDVDGLLHIADTGNCRVRQVSSGIITTVVGGFTGQVVCGYAGDGGPASSAVLNQVVSIAFSPTNDMYIADTSNYCIRIVNALTDIITTFAGSCVNQGATGDGPVAYARFNVINGVTFDALGNLYVMDTGNDIVRKVNVRMATSTGLSNTLAPTAAATALVTTGTTAAATAGTTFPSVVVITTMAGTGVQGGAGDGGRATSAQFNNPYDVKTDQKGNVYIAEYQGHKIRMVTVAGMRQPLSITSTSLTN